MASAVAAAEAAMDPKTDPKRKPSNSKDPGWKYAYYTVIGNRDGVTCTLCDRKLSGGIKRLKEHLAGGFGDTRICMKTTTAIRREMAQALKEGKKKRPFYIIDEDEGEEVVEVIEVDESSIPPPKPSSGTAAKKSRTFVQSRLHSAEGKKEKETKSVVAMHRKKPEDVVDERRSGCSYSQSTMESSTKTKEDRLYVNKQWAFLFCEAKMSFNIANLRQFQVAIEASCQYGPGYKPPSSYELSEPLLEACVKDTRTLRQKHEAAWKLYGCTLMSDGWTDKRKRHLINFLVNSPEGTYFLESIDASGDSQDAVLIADLLQKKIEEIGTDEVVQVVTDNGANYKAAGKLLMERIPTLYWSPCAAHCLDLMLEEIGNLKPFKKTIFRARRVSTFIYRHGRILNAMRHETGGKDLVRPSSTRFATAFLTLRSLHDHKEALRRLFVSSAWTVKGRKLAASQTGRAVEDTILSIEFWNNVEDCLRASARLLIVLRAVDGDEKPAMPEVTALMMKAKQKIKESFCTQNKQPLLKRIMNIVERRWENQMGHPLYGAALYLNQGRFYPIMERGDDELVGELRACFNEVLGRMIQDDDIRNKIDTQAVLYENQRAPFDSVMAKQNIGTRNPLDWWTAYGGRAIDLQRFAKRIVSLCASSSGCERNWSTFEGIHTKKRNRLQHKKLNDLAFVSYNRKMDNRFKERRAKAGNAGFDPLVIEDFDWDNEWVDPSHRPPQGARGMLQDQVQDLTWDDVDEAVGASQSMRGRVPRRGSRQQGPATYSRRATVEEYEEEQVNSDENDSDFAIDDDDLTSDDGEDPMDATEDGDGQGAARNEFDD